MPEGPRIVLAGSVSFSRRTLEGLLRNGADVVGVLGLDETRASRVSDYARMDDVAADAGIPYRDFENVNAPEVVAAVTEWAPDLLFVVGLSQMVRQGLMEIPARAAVGFHPTWLPVGRGRAPVAWLTWHGVPGAATYFVLEETADSGPVLVQEPFFVGSDSYASEVIDAVRGAIDRALDRWVPALVRGEWEPVVQDHSQATFYGRRAPEDGLVAWDRPAREIERLVRTASRPYPGAYTYGEGCRITLWRAHVEAAPHTGVVGRILDVDPDGSPLVQTGDGLLRLDDLDVDPEDRRPRALRVGARLGLSVEDEVAGLRATVAELTKRLELLENGGLGPAAGGS